MEGHPSLTCPKDLNKQVSLFAALAKYGSTQENQKVKRLASFPPLSFGQLIYFAKSLISLGGRIFVLEKKDPCRERGGVTASFVGF